MSFSYWWIIVQFHRIMVRSWSWMVRKLLQWVHRLLFFGLFFSFCVVLFKVLSDERYAFFFLIVPTLSENHLILTHHHHHRCGTEMHIFSFAFCYDKRNSFQCSEFDGSISRKTIFFSFFSQTFEIINLSIGVIIFIFTHHYLLPTRWHCQQTDERKWK